MQKITYNSVPIQKSESPIGVGVKKWELNVLHRYPPEQYRRNKKKKGYQDKSQTLLLKKERKHLVNKQIRCDTG